MFLNQDIMLRKEQNNRNSVLIQYILYANKFKIKFKFKIIVIFYHKNTHNNLDTFPYVIIITKND